MNNNHQNRNATPASDELSGSLKAAVAHILHEPVADANLRHVLERARSLEHSGSWPRGCGGLESAPDDADMRPSVGTMHVLAAPAGTSQPARPATGLPRRAAWRGVGAVACACALALAFFLSYPAGAMQEVAARIHAASAYSCKMTSEMSLDVPSAEDGTLKRVETVKFYWAAPGSVRQERFQGDKLASVLVYPKGKSGLSIDHSRRTFASLSEQSFQPGPDSPGHWIAALARAPGKKATDLGVHEIAGVRAHGYQLDSGEVNPDFPPGVSVRVWVGEESRLPVLLEMESADSKSKMRVDGFEWNAALDPELFATAVPTGYSDATPPPVSNEEKEQAIIKAFAAYSELQEGQYPKVKRIYPDQILDELNRKTAIPRDIREASQEQRKTHGKIHVATVGFGWVFQIQRGGLDVVYHGKTVGPTDKDKVLLRWKQDAGYRVLFGDLHFETISAEKLKELEAR